MLLGYDELQSLIAAVDLYTVVHINYAIFLADRWSTVIIIEARS